MRYCKNENIKVYETEGDNLSLLLIEAAGLVAAVDGLAQVHTYYDSEGGYVVTVYVHS